MKFCLFKDKHCTYFWFISSTTWKTKKSLNEAAAKIEIRKRENFGNQKVHTQALLIINKNDAWDYMSGKLKKPILKDGGENFLKKFLEKE